MTTQQSRSYTRKAKSRFHLELGVLLRRARLDAGAVTRSLGFSSGHISNVEGGYVTPSRYLLEAYIALGADRAVLFSLLDRIHEHSRTSRTLIKLGETAGDYSTVPRRVGDATSPDEVRRHYSVERYDVEFSFNEKGAITQVDSQVGIRALTPGVDFYYSGHAPDARNGRPQAVSVVPLSGCLVEHMNVSPLGACDAYLRLDRTLGPDDPETYELSYRVELSEDQRADPQIAYFTRPGVLAHRLSTRFAPPAVPTKLWWFGAVDSFDADRIRPQNLLDHSDDAVYQREFDQIVPGWCYGFAWLWPAQLIF